MSFLDNTGLAYFYSKLKEKFIRSVTAGNDVLTPDASGNINIVNVPTASNLTSPDAQTSYGTFVYRTSGGSASLTSGDAQLMYVDGNMQIVGRIPENFNITATNGIVVSYDADQWRNTIDTSGTYYFRYARPTSSTATQSWSTSGVWTSDGVGEVILSTYGLTVSGVVDPSISTSVSGSGVTAATVVPSTFGGELSSDGMYEFTYSTTANSWQYLSEDVSLETYGIAVTGTPNDGDVVTINFVAGTPDSVVTVVYTAAERGTIYIPQPTGFSATGFNQFDVDTMVIENATFTSGTIASGANTVAYCRAKGGVDNGQVAYSEGEYILGIGWCAALPEVGSTVVTTGASVAASLASIPFDNDGYVVVEVTDASDLCIHPKWSGAADTDYAEYVAPSTITFPLVDVEDVDLPLKTYGMPRVGAVPDTLDLDAGIYVQRIGRLANTPANMSTVVGYGTDYDYDDDYIYYVLPQSVTYEVEISPDYTVNDWGTEEFLGTEIPCTAQMLYSQNLRDKLRTDVLTISTQTPALTSSELGSVYSNLHLDSFHLSGTITSFPFTIEDERISARSSVVNVVLGTPASVTSDLSWRTDEGVVVISGTLASSSSTTIEFDIAPTMTAVGTGIIVNTDQYLFKECTGTANVGGNGWEAFPVSNTAISGYSIVGAVSYLCTSGAAYINAIYCNTFASPPNMMINSKTAGTVDYKVKLIYERI